MIRWSSSPEWCSSPAATWKSKTSAANHASHDSLSAKFAMLVSTSGPPSTLRSASTSHPPRRPIGRSRRALHPGEEPHAVPHPRLGARERGGAGCGGGGADRAVVTPPIRGRRLWPPSSARCGRPWTCTICICGSTRSSAPRHSSWRRTWCLARACCTATSTTTTTRPAPMCVETLHGFAHRRSADAQRSQSLGHQLVQVVLLGLAHLVKALLVRRPQCSQRVVLQRGVLLGEVACAQQLRMRSRPRMRQYFVILCVSVLQNEKRKRKRENR